jgi:hypothetical protein
MQRTDREALETHSGHEARNLFGGADILKIEIVQPDRHTRSNAGPNRSAEGFSAFRAAPAE